MMLLFYIVAPVVFALTVAWWLRMELRMGARSLRSGWPWLACVVGLQVIAAELAAIYDPYGFGNVLLHTIGGGSVSALLFFYVIYTLDIRVSWRMQLVVLLCFVCTLGVLNELAEFSMELMCLGTFSYDSQDTWRDFVANTVGALGMWVSVRLSAKLAGAVRRRRAGN